MSRRIVTTQLQANTPTNPPIDTYFDRVIKYIPADIVAGWTAVTGLIAGAAAQIPHEMVLWIAFAAFLVLTALWTLKQTRAPDKSLAGTQIAVSTVAFAVWVFALGGPFESLGFYHRVYGSLALIFYTLVVGLVVPSEE